MSKRSFCGVVTWPARVEIVESESPLWHTYHRAWGKCVGLPRYEKRRWNLLEHAVIVAEKSGHPWAIAGILEKIEGLLREQGATLETPK